MHFFVNHSTQTISPGITPKNIVSLVPSLTELLSYLGLEDEVKGITKFCIYPPEWLLTKKIIGGTKNIHLEKIKQLSPNLIISNKEENVFSQIEDASYIAPVWVTDINNLQDAYSMILELGTYCNVLQKARQLVQEIQLQFTALQPINPSLKVAYFIWNKPFMVAASNTFIHEIMQLCGFKNAFENLNRYPEISAAQIITANPQLILLSSEPYPFKEKHVEIFQKLIPTAEIKLVNGEMFSWYGSYLLKTAQYLKLLLEQLKKK
jgi:ABC-type Fe3+-hydroxamate transport system substrate-binding protein